MPTEELFGAYNGGRSQHDHLTDHNWQLEIEGVTTGAADGFAFKAPVEPLQAALLLPAVQSAREAARSRDSDDLLIMNKGDGSYEGGSGQEMWIDVLATDWGTGSARDVGSRAGLRSDGDLVQAVSEADMGGDFIL